MPQGVNAGLRSVMGAAGTELGADKAEGHTNGLVLRSKEATMQEEDWGEERLPEGVTDNSAQHGP